MHWNWKRSVMWGALTCSLLAQSAAHAVLPVEEFGMTAMPSSDKPRVYLVDPSMPHLLDGRLYVLDGQSLNFLAMTGTGFSAGFAANPQRRELYVIATYHSRLQRGARTDVVEVYDADSMALKYEIEVPAKHVQGLPIKALQTVSADGRFLLFQNATPAQSISVVDLEKKTFVTEVNNAGCWGVIPWRANARKFSTVCGDGTLVSIDLDDSGKEVGRSTSTAFFNPDEDPVFMHYERTGDQLTFISFGGRVHELQLDAQGVKVSEPWSLLTPQERKQNWRPGGFQLFALDSERQQLIVGMHANAKEGSHKNLAESLWVYDLKRRQRIGKAPGHNALSITLSQRQGEPARLYVLDGATNEVAIFEPHGAKGLKKPVVRSQPTGDTPVYLEVAP